MPDVSFNSDLPLPAFTATSVPVIEARPPHERVPENSAEASAALCSLIFGVEEPPSPSRLRGSQLGRRSVRLYTALLSSRIAIRTSDYNMPLSV